MKLKSQLQNMCTINEAKDILGLSYQSTLNLILKEEIYAEKLGWGWAIDKQSLKEYRRNRNIIDKKKVRSEKRNNK